MFVVRVRVRVSVNPVQCADNPGHFTFSFREKFLFSKTHVPLICDIFHVFMSCNSKKSPGMEQKCTEVSTEWS